MSKVAALIGGIAGALVIKGIHELVKKLDKDVPHFDTMDLDAPRKHNFFSGDSDVPPKYFSGGITGGIFNNAMHHSMSGLSDKNTDARSGILGIASGLGAIYLPEFLGLNKEHKGASEKKHEALIAIYSLAGVFIATKVVEWVTEKLDRKKMEANY
jgi:hypothetical protein